MVLLRPESYARTQNQNSILVASNTADERLKSYANYVCDGVADDVQIQAAIDALPAGGGTVELTYGTYNITASLVLDDNINLVGSGWNSIISFTMNDGALEAFTKTKIIIRDMKIIGSGNPADVLNTAIHFEDVTDSQVMNCWIEDAGYDAIQLLHGCYRCQIEENHILTPGDDGINIGGDAAPDTQFNTITNNIIDTPGGTGIHLSDGSSYSTVTGNIVISPGIYGIDTNQTGGTAKGHNTIDGNVIYSPTSYGIYIYASANNIVSNNIIYGGTKGIYVTNINCIIQGNLVYDSSEEGIRITDVGVNSTISNNIIYDNTLDGILCDADYCSVQGNVIITAGGLGIKIQGDNSSVVGNIVKESTGNAIQMNSSNSSISNNSLSSSAYGIFVQGGTNNTITGNMVTGGTRAIQINSADNLVIGNSIIGVTAIGIYPNGSARNSIIGNSIDGALTGLKDFNGTDTFFSGNRVRNAGTLALELSAGTTTARIENNDLTGTVTLLGTYTIHNNKGYVTENSGAEAAVADGGTIAHGCAATPTLALVTGSVASEIVSVTALGAANITVAIKTDAGAPGTNQTIYWRAEV